MTRQLMAAGQNTRAHRRAVLERKVREARRMHDSYPGHASEIALAMAEEALARFERGEE